MRAPPEIDQDLSGLPEWVSVREASFLADVPQSIIEAWAESGAVGATRLRLGRGAEVVLVRTEDLLPAPLSMGAPLPTAGSTRKGHLGRRAATRFAQVVALAIVLLGARAMIHPPVTSPEPSPQFVPATGPLADPTHPLETAPIVTPAKTTGGHPASAGSTLGAQADPNGDGGSNSGPSQSPGGGAAKVETGPVQYVRQGSLVSAAVTLTNPNSDQWLPSSSLYFAAMDDRGRVIATYQTVVTLGPGESKIAVAPTLVLGSSTYPVGSVHVTIQQARRQPAATFVPTGLAVSAAAVSSGDGGTTVVTGRVANNENGTANVQIACALFAGDRLAGVGVGSLNGLLPATSSAFVVSVPFVDGQADAADCTATSVG